MFLFNLPWPQIPMAAFCLKLVILLLFPLSCCSQNGANNIVPIGASLTAAAQNSNSWRSPSGDFAFGFQQLPDNKDLFVLSIWFDKIPDKTMVWYENSSYPVPRGSTVRLDAAEGIVLKDPQQRPLFSSNSLKGRTRVANGFMNDTGNFVLQANDSTLLWESFKDPKDTLLPTQILGINGTLISRVTSTNFSRGKFYAEMNGDGNFMLHSRSFPSINTITDDTYYSSETSDLNTSLNSGFQLIFEERAQLFIVKRNGERVALSSRAIPSGAEYYHRATLDFDGLFAQYYYPKKFSGKSSWATADAWPKDVCNMDGTMGSGACGYNSVCTLVNLRPTCQCPTGFSLANPNNSYGDCKPNHAVYCASVDQQGSSDDGYDMEEIQDTVWPGNNYESIRPSTEEQCRNLCLSDCFCGAVGFETDQCWKKRLPLTNGRVDTSLGAKAFLKLRKANYNASSFPITPTHCPPPGKLKKVQGTSFVVVSALLGSSILFNCVMIAAGCLGYIYVYRKNFASPNHTSGSNLRYFSYKSLLQATKGFKEELGRGSFGIVYKGVIPGASKSVVAVKKLDRVAQDLEKEFKAEVSAIGQTHHKNLVSLIGFCDEGPHRLLVYEYMSNGTLADFLFGNVRPSWCQRMEAALGVARGLLYLHEECKTHIIHCDIKPQNILLDESYNAHISDFGLAKALMMNQSKTLTNIRGTKGYVAPEWFKNAQITAKVDVYSFGVVLLEIITCRKSVNQEQEYEDEMNPILTDWVWECFMEGTVENLVENDEEALSDKETLKRNVMIGIWCIQEDVLMRPTMRKVCQMLEGIIEVEVPPCP